MHQLELETAGQFEHRVKSAARKTQSADQADEIEPRNRRRRPAIPLFQPL
jgi:hypothetical protein